MGIIFLQRLKILVPCSPIQNYQISKKKQITKKKLWPFSQTLGLAYLPLNSVTLSCSSEVTLCRIFGVCWMFHEDSLGIQIIRFLFCRLFPFVLQLSKILLPVSRQTRCQTSPPFTALEKEGWLVISVRSLCSSVRFRVHPRFLCKSWATIYSSSGNKHFLTKSCRCQTYQNYEQSQQKLGTFLEIRYLKNQNF